MNSEPVVPRRPNPRLSNLIFEGGRQQPYPTAKSDTSEAAADRDTIEHDRSEPVEPRRGAPEN
jgi:hypothetical protein